MIKYDYIFSSRLWEFGGGGARRSLRTSRGPIGVSGVLLNMNILVDLFMFNDLGSGFGIWGSRRFWVGGLGFGGQGFGFGADGQGLGVEGSGFTIYEMRVINLG